MNQTRRETLTTLGGSAFWNVINWTEINERLKV